MLLHFSSYALLIFYILLVEFFPCFLVACHFIALVFQCNFCVSNRVTQTMYQLQYTNLSFEAILWYHPITCLKLNLFVSPLFNDTFSSEWLSNMSHCFWIRVTEEVWKSWVLGTLAPPIANFSVAFRWYKLLLATEVRPSANFSFYSPLRLSSQT